MIFIFFVNWQRTQVVCCRIFSSRFSCLARSELSVSGNHYIYVIRIDSDINGKRQVAFSSDLFVACEILVFFIMFNEIRRNYRRLVEKCRCIDCRLVRYFL